MWPTVGVEIPIYSRKNSKIWNLYIGGVNPQEKFQNVEFIHRWGQSKNSQIWNLYIGGVSPVPGAAVAKTPFTRERPMVSVSNLKREHQRYL